jgi:BASS family bile acid:Na+ symporter
LFDKSKDGKRNVMKKVCDFITKWMGVLVLLVAVVAVWRPALFRNVDAWVISPMLGLIMFGMGLTMSLDDFRVVVSRPRDILLGCFAQFTIMPLVAWGLSYLFNLTPALAIGVILVGCCPGGTASNVITYLAHGDLALSVGMTAVSTVLAPLLTPLLTLLLAGEIVNVDAWGMLQSILCVVIVPVIAGFLLQHYFPSATKRMVAYLPAFSSMMIAAVVAIVVGHNADKLLSGGMVVVLVVILHNVFGLGIGYILGGVLGITKYKRRAIAIEVGMQNSGLASSLAAIHFAAYPLAAIPGAIFSVWHNISGALVVRIFASQDKCEE